MACRSRVCCQSCLMIPGDQYWDIGLNLVFKMCVYIQGLYWDHVVFRSHVLSKLTLFNESAFRQWIVVHAPFFCGQTFFMLLRVEMVLFWLTIWLPGQHTHRWFASEQVSADDESQLAESHTDGWWDDCCFVHFFGDSFGGLSYCGIFFLSLLIWNIDCIWYWRVPVCAGVIDLVQLNKTKQIFVILLS